MNEVEQIIEWDEPPENASSKAGVQKRYDEVVKPLRENQGKWAKLTPRATKAAAKSLASNIMNGRLASFTPAGAFEAEWNDVDIWVRFVGEEGAAERAPTGAFIDAKTTRAVRTWAMATGRPVAAKGRIAHSLVHEWRQATKGT